MKRLNSTDQMVSATVQAGAGSFRMDVPAQSINAVILC